MKTIISRILFLTLSTTTFSQCASLYLTQPYYDKNKFELDFDNLCKTRKQKNNQWTVQTYIDKFGDDTKEKYLTNLSRFKGAFSNSATENSDLGVKSLIEPKKVSFELYEYDGRNPYKPFSGSWSVFIKEESGKIHKLKIHIFDSRFSIGRIYRKKVFGVEPYNAHEKLPIDMEMGARMFHILMARNKILKLTVDNNTRYKDYTFQISSKGYCNAFKKIKPSRSLKPKHIK